MAEVFDFNREKLIRRPDLVPNGPPLRASSGDARRIPTKELMHLVSVDSLAHRLTGLEYMINTGKYPDEIVAIHAQDANDALNLLSETDRKEVFGRVAEIKAYEARVRES